MNSKLEVLKTEFLEKQKLLNDANKILKQEFFGIDPIIDNITRSVSSWFALSEIQESPLIINLWGLTGVGKTSLISRLVEILDVKDQFFKFDLSHKGSRQSFSNGFNDLCENCDSSKAIIVLDEFQHSRSVKGPNREELESQYNQSIWQLLDTGRVYYLSWRRSVYDFYEYIKKLSQLLNKGVKIKNGKIVSGLDLFLPEFEHRKKEKKPLFFVSDEGCTSILQYAPKGKSLYLIDDVREVLNQLDGQETIDFLFKIYRNAIRPEEKDFSKSLIFVIGNLDEAYSMSSNLSSDMDADEFHEFSLKITLPKIKRALKQRFRDEQIARLGNIHMIYPALSSKAYILIIRNELKKTFKKLNILLGLQVKFDKSVEQLIYNEGVYPTQGVRPILTTINHLIKSNLTDFISEILTKNISVTELKFRMYENNLVGEYYDYDVMVLEKSLDVVTTLEDLRKSKKDDMQAITAVHESGHAVISALLLRTIPEVVYSVTTSSDNSGFVFAKFVWKYISKKELVPRVAMYLGGYAAEELIFGSENVTAGASSDIDKATSLVSDMVKNHGLGDHVISVSLPESANNYNYNNYKSVEEEVKTIIEKGLNLARKTLKEEKKLLLSLANYLSDNSTIKKDKLKSIIERFSTESTEFIMDGKEIFYRSQLKNMIQKTNDTALIVEETESFCQVNKESNHEDHNNN